jgi:hypothetical protein
MADQYDSELSLFIRVFDQFLEDFKVNADPILEQPLMTLKKEELIQTF